MNAFKTIILVKSVFLLCKGHVHVFRSDPLRLSLKTVNATVKLNQLLCIK